MGNFITALFAGFILVSCFMIISMFATPVVGIIITILIAFKLLG